jgi:hypothetical protein
LAILLEPLLEALEIDWKDSELVFVAEMRPTEAKSPESTIAKIWNECLGPNVIPFDPAAREKLISVGCRHPELNRHIEAWKEMKRIGSKWVTGADE